MARWNDNAKVKRLREAIATSRRQMQKLREARQDAVRQYVGYHYSDRGAPDRVPVNLMELLVNTYVRGLTSGPRKVLVTTEHLQYKPMAFLLEMACNRLLQKINFHRYRRKSITDSLFGLTMMKVGLSPHGSMDIGGTSISLGQPFAEPVDLDDAILDTGARSFEEMRFAGNYYVLPFDYVKKSGLYDGDALRDAAPTTFSLYNEEGDERLESMSKSNRELGDDFEEQVALMDVWLPREGVMLTLARDAVMDDVPLRSVEWQGPKHGPYHHLSYNDVPANLLPLSPAALMLDLHLLANTLFNKVARQAERAKTNYAARGGSQGDAERCINAADGEVIRIDDQAPTPLKFAGVDQPTMAAFVMAKDLFSEMGGNLYLLSGLSPASETLGQDQILAGSANKRMNDMQERVLEYDRAIIRDLAWYLFTDPLINLPMTRRIGGKHGIDFPVHLRAEDIEGDFLDYNFDIEPYTMEEQTPATRLNTLMQVWQGVIQPALPLLQAQGMMPDIEGFLRLIARYKNINEMEELLPFKTTKTPEAGPVGRMPVKAQNTTRNYVRQNIPGGSRQGKDQALVQMMMGRGAQSVQPDEAAATVRP